MRLATVNRAGDGTAESPYRPDVPSGVAYRTVGMSGADYVIDVLTDDAVDPATYGFRPDVTAADNTAAWDDVIRVARSLGLPVFLPPGTHNHLGLTLTAWSGMALLGSGNRTVLHNQGTGDALTINVGGSEVIRPVFARFAVNGHAGSGDGIVFDGNVADPIFSGLRCDAVRSSFHGGSGWVVAGAMDRGEFDYCDARDNGAHGFALTFGEIHMLRMRGCAGYNNTHGLHIDAPVHPARFEDCEWGGVRQPVGIYITSTGGRPEHLRFDGNRFEGNYQNHVLVEQGTNAIRQLWFSLGESTDNNNNVAEHMVFDGVAGPVLVEFFTGWSMATGAVLVREKGLTNRVATRYARVNGESGATNVSVRMDAAGTRYSS